MTHCIITNRRTVEARPGVALVVVLWVVMIAGMILMGLQRSAVMDATMAHNELASVQAHWLARAGVEQAIAMLADDLTPSDSTSDLWYDDEYEDSFKDVELADGYWFRVTAPPDDESVTGKPRYGLLDAASRLNVNAADEKQLRTFEFLTGAQIEAILDWRDNDEETRPGGAERRYYQRADFPYEIRNGPFRTHRELLLVRDIDGAAYLGEDANENGMLDANEDDGRTSWPPDTPDGELEPGLAGLTTVYSFELNQTADGGDRINVNTADANALKSELNFTDGLANAVVQKRGNGTLGSVMDLDDLKDPNPPADENSKVSHITLKWLARNLDKLTRTNDRRLVGKININTAPRDVLLALADLTPEAVDAIISYRQSQQGPFTSVEGLFTSEVLNDAQFKAVAEKVTVRSSVLTVVSRGGTPLGIEQTIVAVIDRTRQPMSILYWYQSE